MHLHSVGILAITTIIRADGRLHISHIPGLRSQNAQGSGRVKRASTNLLVVRLPDEAAMISPEVLQGEDDGLKVEGRGHG
jgi:hypothetical protein